MMNRNASSSLRGGVVIRRLLLAAEVKGQNRTPSLPRPERGARDGANLLVQASGRRIANHVAVFLDRLDVSLWNVAKIVADAPPGLRRQARQQWIAEAELVDHVNAGAG